MPETGPAPAPQIGRITPLDAAGLAGSLVGKLAAAGLRTVGDLVDAWPDRVAAIDGIGDGKRQTLAAIVAKLTAKRYAFPTVVRCPKCGSSHTRAVKTEGGYQYRRCQVAFCDYARRSFVQRGTQV